MQLLEVLNNQNVILDGLLFAQKELHKAVKTKNWVDLEANIASINDFTQLFMDLEDERNSICSTIENIAPETEEGKILINIRSKLLQSKIENKSLGDYVNITRNFVQGVLDNAIPQRRNVLYSRNGKIVKPQPESVVLNKIF